MKRGPDTLLRQLLDVVPETASIRSACIGPLWTCVETNVRAALASTFSWAAPHTHSRPVVRAAGSLVGASARTVAGHGLDGSPLEASLAIAALNASVSGCLEERTSANAADVIIETGRDRVVAMIGHFPFAERIRGACRRLDVFELPGRMQPGDLRSMTIIDVLPAADVVAITATTLLTHSLGAVLDACSPSSLKIMLGPTTPLSPVLWGWGFDVLCGVEVIDPPAALRSASEGANLRQMAGLRKVTIFRSQ